MKKISKKTVLLVPLIVGTTLVLWGGAAKAATYNISTEAQSWNTLGHEPGNAGHPMYVIQYYGKGSNNVLNLSPTGGFSPMGWVPDFYAGHGSGHTLNFKGGGNKEFTIVGGTASDNKVVVTGGTVNTVCGGWSYSSGYGNQNTPTNSNTVRISGGNINGNSVSIYGGRSAGTANNNTVVISSGNLNGALVWGGSGSTANGNTVDVSGFDGSINQLYGGDASGSKANASNNVVMLGNTKAGVYKGTIYGGSASGNNASANNNSVQILGGTFGADIYGGSANGSSVPTASNNTVELRKGIFNGNKIYGGWSYPDNSQSPGVAYNNTVVLYEPALNGTCKIYGGYAEDGRAERNSVVILGGVTGEQANVEIIAGDTGMTGVEKNNSIELYKVYDLDLKNAVLFGTKWKWGNAMKDANPTLNVYASDITVKNIKNFAQIKYYLPDTVKNGDTILKAVDTESTDISGTKISVSVPGGTSLDDGDEVYLLTTNAGIMGELGETEAEFNEGVSITRDMHIINDGKSLIGTLMVPFGDKAPDIQLNPETKSFVETASAGMAALNASADFVSSKGFAAAAEAAASDAGRFSPFFAAGGSDMRYNTGSHVDSQGYGLAIGLAKEFKCASHTLLTGPFVEYGNANYDSYLDSGLHASGSNHFTGGGWFLRGEQKNGFLYEASLRFGTLGSDYQSVIRNHDVTYDSSSKYYGFHLGLGQRWAVSKKGTVEAYAKYFHTHQDSDNVHLSTGEQYHFDPINSNRTRLGFRYTHQTAKNCNVYGGLAWDYEFDSEARASYRGYSTPAPSMKGSSGMAEIGVKYTPSEELPLTLDCSVQGWTGKQRGVGASVAFQWNF